MIVHEYFSAPFDPESGKALLSLEPAPRPTIQPSVIRQPLAEYAFG
jgi:hypothetical protein